jgi:hypothetical protein
MNDMEPRDEDDAPGGEDEFLSTEDALDVGSDLDGGATGETTPLAATSPDVGPGSESFETAAGELMGPVSTPELAMPGDFKENWSLFFSAVGLLAAALWLPLEGMQLDLTAKDSIAGGFLVVFAAQAVFGTWANLRYRKMHMKAIFASAFLGLYVSLLRIYQLLFKQLPELEKAAGDEGLDKQTLFHLVGAGSWVILFLSLGVFWTLFQGVRAGAKREQARKEAARQDKSGARRR